MLPSQMSTRFRVALPDPFGTALRETDQLLDQYFRNGLGQDSNWTAPLALWEEEGRLCLEVELSGVDRDDLEVTVEKGRLFIRAERRPPEVVREYWHNERRYGKFERQVALPDFADPDSIDAELSDGVLLVKISKKPEAQPKRIAVKAE